MKLAGCRYERQPASFFVPFCTFYCKINCRKTDSTALPSRCGNITSALLRIEYLLAFQGFEVVIIGVTERHINLAVGLMKTRGVEQEETIVSSRSRPVAFIEAVYNPVGKGPVAQSLVGRNVG